MALQLPTAITFQTKLEGTGLDQLKRQLQGLSQQSTVSKRTLDQLYTATRSLGSASNNTIAGLQKTTAALRILRDQTEVGSRKFKLLTNDIEAAEARLRRFQGTASKTGGIGRGQAILAGVAGGIAAQATQYGVQGAQAVVQVGLDAESTRVRLKALTDEFGEYNQAQQAAARIAQTLRLNTTEAQQGFANFYASLRPTGVTLQEIEKAFIGFTAAARNSGATAAESAGALIQLKQALASGVLQGEELRSIREQAPLVAQAIAKEMGVSVGALKELASQGEITSDVVLRALSKLSETQLDKLNAQFDTGQQALKDLSNAATELGTEVAKTFGPTAVALIRDFTRFVKQAGEVWGSLFGGDGEADKRLQDSIKAREQALRDAARRFPNPFGLNTGERESYLRQREAQILTRLTNERLNRELRSDKPSQDQQQARLQADKERAAARLAAEKKALEDETKIRVDAERKLSEYRLSRIREAQELERRLGDQRQEIERSTAEARFRAANQEIDFAMEAERQRLRAAGLGTDALETQARLNEATRRFTEQQVKIEQDATDRRIQLERTLEDFKLETANGISKILQDAGDKLADKMMQGAQGAAAALGGGGGGGMTGGIIARTGNTGQSTGPHLDIRWADGRPITKADADKYFSLNGRSPSSFGVTSPYGRRRLFGRSFHAGMDFGTPEGTPISLRGGASFLRDLGFTGAGGYAVEIMTPQGPMRLLHLQAGSARRGTAAPATAQMPALPGLEAARGQLNQAIGANRAAQTALNIGELLGSRQTELGSITQELDAQKQAVADQRQEYERMMELQRSGLSPELAKQRVDLEKAARAETTKLQTLRQQLIQDQQISGLTDKQKLTLDEMVKALDARIAKQQEIVDGVNKEARALDKVQQRQQRNQLLADGIANSIGNGIGQAFNVVLSGTKNWGDELRDIAANVLRDIANQLLQIMVIQPLIKGISAGLGGLFNANGNVFDQRGLVPYAMGGVVTRPTIFPFANGGGFSTGVMGEAGPEAILPLRRGRNGRLGVQSEGGGTVVNVSVDASGTNVQGNSGQGQQLGRAIAAAVQAELVKQKRPGGLLAA